MTCGRAVDDFQGPDRLPYRGFSSTHFAHPKVFKNRDLRGWFPFQHTLSSYIIFKFSIRSS